MLFHFHQNIWHVTCYPLDVPYKGKSKSLNMWIFLPIWTFICPIMISKTAQRIFCVHDQSNSTEIISEGGRGLVSELDIRTNTLKPIPRHQLVQKNWAPTKNIYRGVTKILCLVRTRVSYYQQPNLNDLEEISKFKYRVFYYLIYLHNNYFINENQW